MMKGFERMNKTDTIKALRAESLNCAQCVLLLHHDALGISEEDAIKMAGCFGGGMAVKGTCGALTGALMALGFRCGAFRGDPAKKNACHQITEEFVRAFEREYGSTQCSYFTGERTADAKSGCAPRHTCNELIEGASDMLDRLL